jgi:hypothetical protein
VTLLLDFAGFWPVGDCSWKADGPLLRGLVNYLQYRDAKTTFYGAALTIWGGCMKERAGLEMEIHNTLSRNCMVSNLASYVRAVFIITNPFNFVTAGWISFSEELITSGAARQIVTSRSSPLSVPSALWID